MKDDDMLVLDDLPQLRRKVEALQREADRAAGLESHLLARLKEEFNCSSLDEAESKLVELEAEERALAKRYAKRLREWKERWKDVLEETDE